MNIIVFDIETTGLNKNKDQIIQFSAINVNNESGEIIDTINEYIQPKGEYTISLGAYFKHGINVEFLKDKPFMKDVAPKIVEFFGDTENAILTYNGVNFDIPFLIIELKRYGYNLDIMNRKIYDALVEERKRNNLTLENTYLRYKGKTMDEDNLTSHNAISDIIATYSIFTEQQKIKKYGPEHIYGEDNLISDQDFLDVNVPCFNYGKYRGVAVEMVAKIDIDYIKWAASEISTFSDSTKEFLKSFLDNL